jgi:hypothetical protein
MTTPYQWSKLQKLINFFILLSNSGVSSILRSYEKDNDYGRPEYDPLRLFATILYGIELNEILRLDTVYYNLL